MTENIMVFGHNSVGIKSGLGMIYVDPFKLKETPNDASFILVTHEHYDHFSPEDIEKVAGSDTVLVVPESMKVKAQEAAGLVKKIVTVSPGEDRDVDGLSLETVPAYNIDKKFHPKSNEWVGYILKVDGRRIYVAGDTDATPEAKMVKCDVAIIPVGGTYTMDIRQAAALVNEIKPAVAIPVHYGCIVGEASDGEAFAKLVKEPVKAELKIKF
ncbi:metal-dependent hydrolase [Oribacterium sp. C9]|uniref:MBL fold metallo-hydrolase n=1 Tax=Oribacterium sp. C9 TaxID=1943579 RepID=UPI00098F0EA3|nr:MBL fold metallo-hydrolase [Oribacterium sp. C9]OON85669.1 metal-dependent hydrolase [Oribacterium sp. C9]